MDGIHNFAENWCGQSTPEGVVAQFFRGVITNPYNPYVMFGITGKPCVFVIRGCTGFTGCLMTVDFCTRTGTAGRGIGQTACQQIRTLFTHYSFFVSFVFPQNFAVLICNFCNRIRFNVNPAVGKGAVCPCHFQRGCPCC